MISTNSDDDDEITKSSKKARVSLINREMEMNEPLGKYFENFFSVDLPCFLSTVVS